MIHFGALYARITFHDNVCNPAQPSSTVEGLEVVGRFENELSAVGLHVVDVVLVLNHVRVKGDRADLSLLRDHFPHQHHLLASAQLKWFAFFCNQSRYAMLCCETFFYRQAILKMQRLCTKTILCAIWRGKIIIQSFYATYIFVLLIRIDMQSQTRRKVIFLEISLQKFV